MTRLVAELAYQHAAVAIAVLDTDGNFLDVNPRFCEIVGRARETMIGASALLVSVPEERDEVRDIVSTLLSSSQSTCSLEKQYLRADGSRFTARLHVKAVRDANGAATSLVVTVEDINSQKAIENRLYESYRMLESSERVASIASWQWNIVDGTLEWSNGVYEIFGVARNIPPNFQLFISKVHPNDRSTVEATIQNSLTTGADWECDYRVVRSDGERHVRAHGSISRGASGRIEKMIGICRDVTERDQLEARVRQYEFEFRQVLDAIPDLIFIKRPDSSLRWANRALLDYYAKKSHDLEGKVDDAGGVDEIAEAYRRADLKVFETGATLNIAEERIVRHDGAARYFHTVKSPIRDQQGRVVLMVGVSRDVTERREASELLEQQRAQLMLGSKMSALGEMASGVAHEINNPLAVILGRTSQLREILNKGSVPVEKLAYGLERIEVMAARIANIVKSLRTFSRSAENDVAVRTPIGQIVDDTLELCRSRFLSRGIELRVGEVPEIEFECRPGQISQIILNLLNNALDAVATTKNPWVNLEIAKAGDHLTISVTDSGTGIPETVATRMMEPFYTTKDPGEGTGLGLSITKGLCEGHSGVIRYDRESANTRFVVELPIHQDPLARAA